MLPTNNEKEDSCNLVDEKSKQLQSETRGDSLKKSLTIIGIIFFVVIITSFFEIENISSQPKLLAWSSHWYNKINIVEIETQEEFANFEGVKLNNTGNIFQLFTFDSNSVTIY